jgi:tape measure domain-containing protein
VATTAQIKIEAQVSQALTALAQIEKSLSNLTGVSSKASAGMEKLNRAATGLSAVKFDSILNLFQRATGGVQGLVNLADASTQVNNKLIAVMGSSGEAAAAFQQVGRIAKETGQGFEVIGDLYQKVALQSQNLGLSQTEVARIVENVSKGLTKYGASAQQAASFTYQFSQALGRGTLKFEDFRDMLEASPAMVAGIAKQFGMTTAQFLKAVQAGKFSSEELALAMNNMTKDVDLTGFSKTIGQSFENIRTSFILMINNFEKSTGVFAGIAKLMDLLARNIDIVTVAAGAFMAVFAAQKILQMAIAFKTLNTVMKANPMILLATVAAGIAVSIYDMVKGSEDLGDATKDVLEKEEKIRGVKDTQLNGAKDLTKEQENALKALNSTIVSLGIQTQYLEDVIQYGQVEADLRKAIREEAEKLEKQGLKLSQQDEDRIRAASTKLTVQKAITEEIKRQESVANGLANAYKSNLTKALDDAKDAAANLSRVMGNPNSSNQDQSKAFDAQEQAVKTLNAEILNLTVLGASQRYAVEAEYQKNLENLERAYYEKSALFIQQGVSLEEAKYQLLQNKEIELYNLKMNLMAQEEARRAALLANQMSNNDAFYLKSIGGEKEIQEAAKTRAEFENKTTFQKTQFGIEQGAMLFNALGAQNKKAFELAKAFNIANAIMNTYMAATKALASYPPPINFAMAAVAVGMGLAQVAQIRGQTYSGRALGGPVMGNNPYIVGENGPELFTPSTTGSITRNDQLGGGGPVNINFNIQTNDAQGFDDLLIERKGMIQQFVADAMLERGQRSRM